MFIKLKKHDGGELIFQCDHIGVTHVDTTRVITDVGPEKRTIELTAGIDVELCGGPDADKVLNLPSHGDAIFVMNDFGGTVQTYRYPPRGKLLPRTHEQVATA